MLNHAQKWRSALDLVASAAMTAASLVLIAAIISSRAASESPGRNQPAMVRPLKPIPPAPISLDGATRRGAPSAHVGVLEYVDFECPFCARFHDETYPTLLKNYIDTGKVVLAIRHLPLESKHQSALRAAQAADCSGRQGRFWLMHDQLFRAPRALSMDNLIAKGQQIGLDMSAFRRCLVAETTETVQRDIASARELSITGTPTFLIGTITAEGRLKVARRQSGAIPSEVLSRILDDLLRTAEGQ